MTKQEALKKFDFDMKFKYNSVYFILTNKNELSFLYSYIKNKLNLTTNSSYIEFLLDGFNKDINIVVYINQSIKISDAWATKYAILNIVSKDMIIELPEYLKKYYFK